MIFCASGGQPRRAGLDKWDADDRCFMFGGFGRMSLSFIDAVRLAYNTLPMTVNMLWFGISLYTIDGSQFILPATENIRETFDQDSGLSTNGKGHFPYCLVSTLYDVFRRIPVARTIVDSKGSEREEAEYLLKQLPTKKNLILFDRGYPGFELIHLLTSMKKPLWMSLNFMQGLSMVSFKKCTPMQL